MHWNTEHTLTVFKFTNMKEQNYCSDENDK